MIDFDTNNSRYIIAKFTPDTTKLNVVNAEKAKTILQNSVETDSRPIILDFEHVSYIDSSGIGAVISVYNYGKNRNCNIVICNLSEKIMALVKITKLNDVLKIYTNATEAIASFEIQ